MTSAADLAGLILARLGTIPNLTVFDGKVGAVLKDGNITRPYTVLYMSPGQFVPTRLCGRSESFRVTGQITVAAGTVAGFRWAAGRVLNVLTDYRLEPANRGASTVTFPGDPGPERRDDDDPNDIRWYIPLPFSLITTRS